MTLQLYMKQSEQPMGSVQLWNDMGGMTPVFRYKQMTKCRMTTTNNLLKKDDKTITSIGFSFPSGTLHFSQVLLNVH